MNRYLFQPAIGRMEMRVGDVPQPGARQVRVRVMACGICGSDLHYFAEGAMGEWSFSPYMPGHEAAGIVEAVGEGVTTCKVGDRVTIEPQTPCGTCYLCRHGFYNLCQKLVWLSGAGVQGVFADYVCTDETSVFPIPEQMTFQQGAMVEPAAVALHAVNRATFKPGDTGIILGMGTIGLLTLQAFKAAGGGKAICVDVLPSRLALAKELGADMTLNAQEEPVDLERKGNVVFETAGAHATVEKVLEMAKIGGCVAQIGWPRGGKVQMNVARLIQNELTYVGVHKYAGEFPGTIKLIADGRIRVDPLITDTYALEECQAAFERAAKHPDQALKVMFLNHAEKEA